MIGSAWENSYSRSEIDTVFILMQFSSWGRTRLKSAKLLAGRLLLTLKQKDMQSKEDAAISATVRERPCYGNKEYKKYL